MNRRKLSSVAAAAEMKVEGRKRACKKDLATTGRVKGKRPCVVGNSSSASPTTARKAQVKGKRPCVEDPTSPFFDQVEIPRVNLSETEGVGFEAPGNPLFMDLSEYEAVYGRHRGEIERLWEGGQVVTKVPRWAHEEAKRRAKMLDADCPMTPDTESDSCESYDLEDDPLLKVPEGWNVEIIKHKSGISLRM